MKQFPHGCLGGGEAGYRAGFSGDLSSKPVSVAPVKPGDLSASCCFVPGVPQVGTSPEHSCGTAAAWDCETLDLYKRKKNKSTLHLDSAHSLCSIDYLWMPHLGLEAN